MSFERVKAEGETLGDRIGIPNHEEFMTPRGLREQLLTALTDELGTGWLPPLTDPYQVALTIMERIQPIIGAEIQKRDQEIKRLAELVRMFGPDPDFMNSEVKSHDSPKVPSAQRHVEMDLGVDETPDRTVRLVPFEGEDDW